MQPFERYKHYKPAPIACLGEVPAHWDTSLLSYLFTENKEKNTGNIEDTVLSLSYGKVILKKGKENFGLLPAAYDTYQIINPGYLVFRFTDMQNDHVSLRVGLAQDRGIITSAYVGLKPRKELSSKYYYYLFHTLDILKFYYSFGGGVRQSLDYKGMRRIQLPLPPLAEQTAIANFLDCKTAQIDQFVALKEKTIALLQEQKAALINRAVTQGLNPAAPMKDSGIEWLGEIPTHWEVKKTKYIFEERVERSPDGEGVLLMMSQEFGLVERAKFHEKAEAAATTIGHKMTEYNDLVFNKLKAHLGVFFRNTNKVKGLVSPDYAVYYSTKNIAVKYYECLYRHPAYIALFISKITGIVEGLKRLYTSDFFDVESLFPPLAEQHQIVAHIEQSTAKIDQAIAQAQEQIDLIKEYRESLISQAVTGKIRVFDNEPGTMSNA